MPDPDPRPGGNPLAEGVPVSLLMDLLRHMPACVAVYAPDGTCLAASASLARWLQQPAESLVGRAVESIWPGDFGRVHRARLQEVLRGPGTQCGEEYPSPSGPRSVHVVRFAWREGNEARGVVEMFQEQSIPVTRAETVGRLALGVAHDFNNALTLVQGRADLLEHAIQAGEDAGPSLAELRQALDHACRLPRQLLRFVREEAGAKESVDLNALLDSVRGLLRPRLGPNLKLRTEPAPGGAWLEGDPTQLTQVLLNLALNALDAMPAGGELTLRAERLDSGVRLVVADTGRGMSPEVQQRMFDALYTTRPGGSGLGLYMVREMVQRHGGRLACQSAPGRGTTFTIDLPRRAGEEVLGVTDGVGLGATVLVIERDSDIRQLTGMILAHGGYTALVSADVEDARRQAEAHGAPVRLLLLDAEMLAARGERELSGLLARFPAARVLFMTTGHVLAGGQAALPDAGVVTKPFRADQLLRAVEASLQGP